MYVCVCLCVTTTEMVVAIQAPLLDWPYRDLRVSNNDRTLEVINADIEDAGVYSCLATNPAGQDEVDFTLQVFGELCVHRLHSESLY